MIYFFAFMTDWISDKKEDQQHGTSAHVDVRKNATLELCEGEGVRFLTWAEEKDNRLVVYSAPEPLGEALQPVSGSFYLFVRLPDS